MAEIPIDLSGAAGLANGHAGDNDMITPQPQLRTVAADGEMVAGIYNPHLRKGYLAPSTTTSVSVTTDVAASSQFVASEYDIVSDSTYWADSTKNIYLGSGLNDTSLVQTLVLDADDVGTYPDRQYESLYDLQLYQLNGERKVFFVGKGLTYAGSGTLVRVATETTARDYGVLALAVLPESETKPAVVDHARAYTTGANTGVPFTVAGGTGSALIAVVITEGTGSDILGASWRDESGTPTYSMTESASGSSGGFFWKVFTLANPLPVTTGEVRFFVNTATSRLLYVFETNNTDQTSVVEQSFNVEQSSRGNTDIYAEVEAYDVNQLDVVVGYSENATIPTENTDIVEQVYDDNTHVDGSDFFYRITNQVYGLQVGVADLDLTLTAANDASWLALQTTSGFTHELPGNYAFMRTADNGFAYLFAGHRVHKIDGTFTGGEEGTVTKDVLLFPDYFRISDAIDYRSSLYIAIQQYPVDINTTSLNNYQGRCGIYVWNRVSVQLSSADYIEIPGVREIKKIYGSPDGVIKLITISDSGITELRQFGYNDSGGVVFPVVRELGIGAYPQVPDGCQVAGDKTLWLANNGYLYTDKQNSITKVFEASIPGATTATLAQNITSGAILYGSGTETADTGFRSNKQGVVMSYDDGGTVTHEKVYPFDIKTGANAAQTPNTGDVYTKVIYIPTTSLVKRVRIYNAPVTSTGSTAIATVKLYFNQSTTASMPTGMTKTVTLDEAKRGYVDFNISKPYVNSIQLEFEWASGTPIGQDMYLPSLAIISTEETGMATPDGE